MNTRTIALTAMLLCAVLASADDRDSITFAASSVNAGDSWTDISSYETSLALSLNDSYRELPPTTQTTSVSREKRVTVLSAQGNDKLTGVEVEYDSVEINGVDVTPAYAGKKYVITVQGNKPATIKYANGDTPSDDELLFVASDNNRHGQLRAMNKTFGGKTVAVGDTLRVSNPDDLIDAEAGMRVRDFSMTLKSIEGDTAIFDVVLELSSDVRKPKKAAPDASVWDSGALRLDLTGTLEARATTSRIVALTLTGPASISSRKATSGKKGPPNAQVDRVQTMSGEGEASLSSSYTYP